MTVLLMWTSIVGVSIFSAPLAAQEPQDLPVPSSESPTSRQVDRPPAWLPPAPPVEAPTRNPTPLPQAASSVSVIQGDELRTLGVRFLTDAFRSVPGVEVQRLSSTESNVTMRGYNDDAAAAQGILGLVDGRQVYNEFFGGVIWDMLPVTLDDVDRIEVVRGPGSFVYGPNAMHGLVSIKTRSPLAYEEDMISFSSSAGSYNSTMASALYVRREENSALKMKFGWDDIDEFQPSNENSKDKAFFETRFETQFDEKGNHRLDLSGGMTQQKVNVLIPQFSGVSQALLEADVWEPYLKLDHRLDGLITRASWTHFDAIVDPDVVYPRFEVLSDFADVDIQLTGVVGGSHKVTGGTGYRYATYVTDDLDVSGGRHSTGLGWAFIQDEYEAMVERVWLTGGVRVDYHSVTRWSISPRLAAVWQFIKGVGMKKEGEAEKKGEGGHYLRASVGYGFRNPSLRELWFNMPILAGGATLAGNDRLDPEQMRSFELGYSGEFAKRFRVTANAYYNLVDDLIEFRAVSPTVLAPINAFKEEAYGIEVGGEIQVSPGLWSFANYSYAIRQDRDTGKRNATAPRHKASAGARYRLIETTPREYWEDKKEHLSAMLWATFFDGVEFFDTAAGVSVGSIDSYTMLNARVSVRLPIDDADAHFFVQAFNLLDHDHREQTAGDSYGAIFTAGLDFAW